MKRTVFVIFGLVFYAVIWAATSYLCWWIGGGF